MISHDVALDLAADRLDFALTTREDQELKEHLRACDSCALYAQAVSEDDVFLEHQRWDNSDDSWREDDEYAPQPADDDEDGDGKDIGVDLDSEERGGGPSLDEDDEEHDDSTDIAQGSTQSDDDDDVDDDARDASTGDSDDPGAMGDASEGDSDDDDAHGASGGASLDDDDESGAEDQASTVSGGRGGAASDDDEDLMPSDDNEAAAQQEMAGGDGQGGPAAGGPPPDAAEDQTDAAQAEAEADAMTDEELAGVDEQPAALYFPECAADGVEAAATKNGARVNSDTNKQAEQSVRAAEGTEDTDYGKVAVYRSIRGLTSRRGYEVYGYSPEVSSSAAAAIRNAILRSRTGHTGVDRRTSRGRLDSMSIHRVAMRDGRIFKRINAPAPGNYLVWVMVDCSSSMAGKEIADAASVARALADASTGTPTVRLAVWGWSSPFLYNAAYGATAGVAKVWETGQPTSEVFKLTQLSMGGTPDATVLDWARRAIFKETRSDEVPVIILASDGFGDRHLPDVVAKAVKHGVVVKSVALGYGVQSDRQEATFGKNNYVGWRGSILETARPLATMIGRMAAGL